MAFIPGTVVLDILKNIMVITFTFGAFIFLETRSLHVVQTSLELWDSPASVSFLNAGITGMPCS